MKQYSTIYYLFYSAALHNKEFVLQGSPLVVSTKSCTVQMLFTCMQLDLTGAYTAEQICQSSLCGKPFKASITSTKHAPRLSSAADFAVPSVS
jgi:hypothetical protein